MENHETARGEAPIPGIYNYCDWCCERCSFSNRCEVYRAEDQELVDRVALDGAFMNTLQQIEEPLREAIGMLEEIASETGVDLSDIDAPSGSSGEGDPVRRSSILDTDELCIAAQVYGGSALGWLKSADELLDDKRKELEAALTAQIPGVDPESDAMELCVALETVQRYCFPMVTKLARAVAGSLDEPIEGLEEYPLDSDGSAKVALIAMDESIEAWAVLRKHFPAEEPTILDFLSRLGRLRRESESMFPNARSFVRPGFDEPI